MANYQAIIEKAEQKAEEALHRAKKYRQKQRTKVGKERTHRICQRGGYIEKVLPETIELSEEKFREFIDLTLKTDFAGAILKDLTGELAEQTDAESADADAQDGDSTVVDGVDAPPKADSP